MCDSMTFPATVDEFMEEYKVVDSEHVYSNGMEMVPIFRMKQWFEHEANHNADPGKMVESCISRQPKRGEWLINTDGYYPYCSKCKKEPKSGEMTDFCPNCGADMRGEQDE